ncbi:hypothetical protein E2C01_002303 [Portunus trituberculatus]|uniref:Nuclear pore complex protein Nup214 n=1 Tax=Portunus trituberculatus TaxID=210409 RepID=A0A5B7CMY0_PORTR|nr:hypothetical protein [Portunus trituberculatus]
MEQLVTAVGRLAPGPGRVDIVSICVSVLKLKQAELSFEATLLDTCSQLSFMPGSGGGGGGGFFSGLGSKPSAENANKNVFGAGTLSAAVPQTSLFGTSSSSSSPFQSSVFGGAANSGTGGGGSFSSGGGPVANTGFAVTTPQSPVGVISLPGAKGSALLYLLCKTSWIPLNGVVVP